MIPSFEQMELIMLHHVERNIKVNIEASQVKALADALTQGFVQAGRIPVLKVTHKGDVVYIPVIPVNKPYSE